VGTSLALRAEARDAGVKVTAVCPGYIRTGLFAAARVESRRLELDLSDPEALVPFPFVDVDAAVRRTLRGVRRNRAVVAFPGYVRLLWALQRFAPWVLSWGATLQLRRMRER
jgi:short-subunit dehydrogenase